MGSSFTEERASFTFETYTQTTTTNADGTSVTKRDGQRKTWSSTKRTPFGTFGGFASVDSDTEQEKAIESRE